MPKVFEFNISDLDVLIKKYGLRKTWINILATHLSPFSKFKYVLNSQEFSGHTILKSNLIEGLSIGEISILYEYSLTFKDSKSRRDNGQYFTPDDVARFMVEMASKFPSGTWLDPCSGIGNLSWHLTQSQLDPEKFLMENILLSDKDSLALLVARVLFTFNFQNRVSDLFTQIKDRFIELDFLSVSEPRQPELFSGALTMNVIPKHDFVIVNPPYLSTAEDARFETSKCRDLYGYFLENIIKSSIGFVSITPQSFTNSTKFYSLRKLLLENFSDITIFAFDNVPANIFKGIKFGSTNSNQVNSTRAAITIALNGKRSHRITRLTRWTSQQRASLFKSSINDLATLNFSPEFFPKVGKPFLPVYKALIRQPRLEELLSQGKTSFPLYVPSAPRYFISALKKPVKRSSMKTLYFKDEKSRDKAYLLINSSLMYWWWRTRDGGMTLSLETLKSLPTPNFEPRKSLVSKLEESERSNRVYKLNAGSKQENVKHPEGLIMKLNKLIVPDYADILLSLHQNSDVNS